MSPLFHTHRFYLSPREAWDAMYRDCEAARVSIEYEQYIFAAGGVGLKFMELFIKKAAEGVKVHVVADKFGSRNWMGSPLIKQLRKNGGKFRYYHWITWLDLLRPWVWYPRTHVKSLLVDSEIAYTGGVCLCDFMEGWRDTQIRVTGPVVAQFRRAFDVAEKLRKVKDLNKAETGQCGFEYLQNDPLHARYVIYKELVRAIGEAKHCIYLTTPLFAPNRRFRRLLAAAARRGADVRLLVPEHAEHPLVDWLGLSYCGKLLDAGVRVFRYEPSMLHAKTAVIDNNWATVGSMNMDRISLALNRESNLIIREPTVVAELKDQFMRDLQASHELTHEKLHTRPLWIKVAGYMARALRGFV